MLSCGGYELRLWDVVLGECIKTIKGNATLIWSVAVARDGTRAISGQTDGTVAHWDLERGLCVELLKGHKDVVRFVQITQDGRHAVSGSDDKTCKIWNLETGACLGTLEGHKDDVDSVALSPDGALIASTGFTDHTVRLWDFSTGNCLFVIRVGSSPFSVAFSLDAQRLVVGTTGGEILVYRLTPTRAAPVAEPTRRYANAKVVLMDESGVGKSALAHRLIEDEFVQTDSTHGMQVWRLDLPLKQEGDLEREALLWDLAGQEDYRLIHQLFLDETALALMLFNPQSADPFTELGVWLKVLSSVVPKDRARDVPKLLIAARVDVGGVKVSQQKIDRFLQQHGLAAYLPTSAKRGDNCSDKLNGGKASPLKELIAKHVPWEKLPWTTTPRLVAELKNAVTAMTEQYDIRLLRFAELAQRLEQALPREKFDESERPHRRDAAG